MNEDFEKTRMHLQYCNIPFELLLFSLYFSFFMDVWPKFFSKKMREFLIFLCVVLYFHKLTRSNDEW